MADMFFIKRGDTSPALRFALSPASVDLTGAAVRFQMRARNGTVLVDSDAVIDSLEPPIVRYAWVEADTTTAGSFQAEFRVTYADGSIETFPNVGFIGVLVSEDVR